MAPCLIRAAKHCILCATNICPNAKEQSAFKRLPNLEIKGVYRDQNLNFSSSILWKKGLKKKKAERGEFKEEAQENGHFDQNVAPAQQRSSSLYSWSVWSFLKSLNYDFPSTRGWCD